MNKKINDAIVALRKLGVHYSVAKKSLFSLIHQNKIHDVISALSSAVQNIHTCSVCNNISDAQLCSICLDSSRNKQTLLILETAIDLYSIEQSNSYNGIYYVLQFDFFHSNSNLDMQNIHNLIVANQISEIIIATNSNLNGEILSHILLENLHFNIRISRIAQGIPFGYELNNVDSATITSSINSRKVIRDI